ncbi:MAG: DMT family transporter [Chlorobi bacterium]|nr:DMT family transporter [Chlorobiota bacterium]
MEKNKNSIKGLLFAAITSLLWGVLAIALKIALKYFDPYTIVWFRFFIAFISLFTYYAIVRPSFLKILYRPPGLLVLAAVLISYNYIGFMQGINYAGPGITQVLIQAGAILLGIVGFIFFKEKITLLRGAGFIIAGAGFFLFYSQQLKEFIINQSSLNTGVAWTLSAAVAWTGYAVIFKLLVRKWPTQQLNIFLYALPVLIFLPLADFSLFTQPLPWYIWVLLISLGLNTIVAYGSLSMAFKYAEANKISIIITLNPIITFVLLETMLFFNVRWIEISPFTNLAYIGAFLVISGAVLAIGIKKR